MTQIEPTRLLIAAMGGEGGGVLAGWLTQAALVEGLWVQRTSVPGVAQRTGATTYYLEFLPRSGDRRPVMALNPIPGRVDVLVATELLEAMRVIQLGYCSPDRTYLIGSTHRVYTVDEKSAMADGRLDTSSMADTCRSFARQALMTDLGTVATRERCHLNAVILGALIGSGTLPIGEESCRAVLAADDRAIEPNLRGFTAGLALAKQPQGIAPPTELPAPAATPAHAAAQTGTGETGFLPPEPARLAEEGLRRLRDFQDEGYAQAYLGHLRRLAQNPAADPAFLGEVARQMAVRMSYEDTFRVAQLKLRDSRLAKVRAEARSRPGDIVDVTEYMKPGPEEIFGMFPRGLGERLMGVSERRGWGEKSFPMKVRTTRFSGFLRLRVLAGLRRWRPRTLRHAQEMAWLDRWLEQLHGALAIAPAAAKELAETAKLVRGYGTTYKRGLRNWTLIDREIVAPTLAGTYPAELFADAVMQARLAALADPDGQTLDRMIAAFAQTAGTPATSAGPANRDIAANRAAVAPA